MTFAKPPLPPPASPVLFRCPSCGVEERFSRDQLETSSALPMTGAGVFHWRRKCACGDMMQRLVTLTGPPPQTP